MAPERSIAELQQELTALTATMDQFVEHAKVIWQAIDELRETVDYRLADRETPDGSIDAMKQELKSTLFQVFGELQDDLVALIRRRTDDAQLNTASSPRLHTCGASLPAHEPTEGQSPGPMETGERKQKSLFTD